MVRTEGTRRPLAVDEQPFRVSFDRVLFNLAGVVRDIVEERQLGVGEHLGEGVPDEMRDDLAIG